MKLKLPELKIGNLTARLPIIQGGMGVGISMSGLASAVANNGGIGVISAVGLGMLKKKEKDYTRQDNITALRAEIRKARSKTKGIIGLNVMVALTDYDELVKTALEEKVDILFLGAGLPLKMPKGLTIDNIIDSGVKIFPIVSSARAANLIFSYWQKHYNHVPDGVVVEGPKAGGHLGFKSEQIDNPDYALENILPEVITTLNRYSRESGKEIPVIAAGGIYSGMDVEKFLAMGASGIQMGTRFIATKECDASKKFKKQFIKARKENITIIKSPVGLPGRAINNSFLEDVAAGKQKPLKCGWQCLKTCDVKSAPYCIARALTNAQKGLLKEGFAFSGSNGYLIKKITTVKKLFKKLKKEFAIARGLRLSSESITQFTEAVKRQKSYHVN